MPNLWTHLCVDRTPDTLPAARNSIAQICLGGLAPETGYEAVLAVLVVLVFLLRSSIFSLAQLHALLALLFERGRRGLHLS
jgi:hypothetical protein